MGAVLRRLALYRSICKWIADLVDQAGNCKAYYNPTILSYETCLTKFSGSWAGQLGDGVHLS